MPAIISKISTPKDHQSFIKNLCLTCGLAVALVQQNLGRDVIGRPYAGLGLAGVANFRKAEVAKFEVALEINEKVFGLQVSVKDVEAVQVLEHEDHLSGVEYGLFVFEDDFVSHVGKEVSALNEFE